MTSRLEIRVKNSADCGLSMYGAFRSVVCKAQTCERFSFRGFCN